MSLLYGYDPPLDLTTELRCVTPGCAQDVTWHPETETEWQGTREQGGMVAFYIDDTLNCPEYGAEGAEV